jgi:hypothetical protein
MKMENFDPITIYGAIYRKVADDEYEMAWTLKGKNKNCKPGQEVANVSVNEPTSDNSYTFCYYNSSSN